jgi:hypothetical protein
MQGLDLWNAVEGVDARYTKKIEGREFSGDTVNLTYTTKKLTEALGPAGDRWGWEVVDEKVHEYGSHENQDFTAIHAVRVRLWFRREDGTTGHIEDYGTTKLAYYAGRRGEQRYLKVDEEACKKSLSDAKSKLFVALGGSAQVWLGEFDRTQHKYMGRDDDRPAPRRIGHPASEQPGGVEPPGSQRTFPAFMLDGVALSAEDWLDAAVLTAKRLQPSALLVWWEKCKDERAKMHKQRPDLGEKLDKLSAWVKKKGETFNGTNGQPAPDQLVRAG